MTDPAPSAAYRFRCGLVVPGCPVSLTSRDETDVLVRSARHAWYEHALPLSGELERRLRGAVEATAPRRPP